MNGPPEWRTPRPVERYLLVMGLGGMPGAFGRFETPAAARAEAQRVAARSPLECWSYRVVDLWRPPGAPIPPEAPSGAGREGIGRQRAVPTRKEGKP